MLTQWCLVGFILLVNADVPLGTPPWLRLVPTPDHSGAVSLDDLLALTAWEDLDMVAWEVLGMVVSAQIYWLLLGNLS